MPAHPAHPVMPAHPAHPVMPAHPAHPVMPAHPLMPAHPVMPAHPAHPVTPARPVVPPGNAGERSGERGFTLLEVVLAVGILSVVLVQVLGVESSSIMVTQIARDNMRATWALRTAMAQTEYILDAYGVKGLPKEATFPWSGDRNFVIHVVTKETPIEASKLFFSAVKIGTKLGDGGSGGSKSGGADKDGASDDDPTKNLQDVGQLLDSQVPKDLYQTVNFDVTYPEGDNKRSLSAGFLVIDDKFALAASSMIPGAGAGGTGTGTGGVPGASGVPGAGGAGTGGAVPPPGGGAYPQPKTGGDVGPGGGP